MELCANSVLHTNKKYNLKNAIEYWKCGCDFNQEMNQISILNHIYQLLRSGKIWHMVNF